MSKWADKKVLVIGDSITADGRWQNEFANITGAIIKTHAYGGIGLIDMIDGLGAYENHYSVRTCKYDNVTGCNGPFNMLMAEEISDTDLIIILGGYNERDIAYGEISDIFPQNNTFIGKYSYVVEKLYSMLDKANNLDCRILLVTPHCVGKYDWINVDGYGEFPEGSGRSLKTMAETIKKISEKYNIPCCDSWHISGINKFTWKIYANSPTVYNENYNSQLHYDAPFPRFADQAHLNDLGYKRLGACIAGFAETIG